MYLIFATILFIAGVAALAAIVTILMVRAEKEEKNLSEFEQKKILKRNLVINCPTAAFIALAICCFSFVGHDEDIAYAYNKRSVDVQREFKWHEPELTPEVRAAEAEVRRRYEKAKSKKPIYPIKERKKEDEK